MPPIEPDDAELIEAAITSRLLDLHTCMPGKVVKYDAAKQVADIQPVVTNPAPNEDGSTTPETRPIIPHVPVQWLRAGGYSLHFPLAEGDHGWLIFNEDAIALWRTSGQLSAPGDLTRHSIAYPFFLPGAAPDSGALPDAPASGEAVIIVPPGGVLRVSEAGSGAAAQPVMTASAFMDALNAGVTAAGGAAVATGAGGASAAFTAFASAFSEAAISSSKLKAQFP